LLFYYLQRPLMIQLEKSALRACLSMCQNARMTALCRIH